MQTHRLDAQALSNKTRRGRWAIGPRRSLADGKRITIRLTEREADAWHCGSQTLSKVPQYHTFTVGVQQAEDRQPRSRRLQGVVMLQFAGEIELGVLGDRVMHQRPARASGAGGEAHLSGQRSGQKHLAEA